MKRRNILPICPRFPSIDGIFRSESGALIYHEAKEIKGRCPDARFAVENGVFGE